MVTTVWLDSNDVGEIGAQALTAALKVNTALRVLSLGGNQIGDTGVAFLAEALKVNNVLTALIVGNNRIGPAGAATLGRALQVNTGLRQLYLQNNKLSDDGAIELSNGLRVNKALTHLMLQNTKIGPEGAHAIGEMLKINSNIASLHLQDNDIGIAGGMVMGDMLQANSALVTLDMMSTGIGNPGAMWLSEGLATNTHLTQLNLENNGISKEGATKLASALVRNAVLLELGLMDGKGNNVVEGSTKNVINLQLMINNDPTKLAAKQLRINPCHGLTAELHCGGHGALAIASQEQKIRSAGAACVCKECVHGFSGIFCEMGPCHGKTSEIVCNGRGRPVESMMTTTTADQKNAVSSICKCTDCTPWYSGDACEIYNPCGTYADDCETLVGKVVLDHFLELDTEYLNKLGVRSVVDLLLLRGDAANLGSTPTDATVEVEEPDAHINAFTKPLKAEPRKRFIAALKAAAPLEFSTGDKALHFNNTVPLSLWGDSIHLPRAVVNYFLSLGLDEPADLMDIPETDLNYMRVGDLPPNPHNEVHSLGVDDKYPAGVDDSVDRSNPGASQGKNVFADTDRASGGFEEGALKTGLKHVDIIRLVAAATSMSALKPREEHTEMMRADAERDMAEDAKKKGVEGNGCSSGSDECEAEFVSKCIPHFMNANSYAREVAWNKCSADIANEEGPIALKCVAGCVFTQPMTDAKTTGPKTRSWKAESKRKKAVFKRERIPDEL